MDRLHERSADAAAAFAVDHRDGDFWRRLVDESLAVLVLGEEAVPRRAPRRSILLGDERRVAVRPHAVWNGAT